MNGFNINEVNNIEYYNNEYEEDVEDVYTVIDEIYPELRQFGYGSIAIEKEAELEGDAANKYYRECLENALEGFNKTIFNWDEESFSERFIECREELMNIKDALGCMLENIENNFEGIEYNLRKKRCDCRVCLLTLGIIYNCFVECKYCGDEMREWQKALMLEIVSYFLHIAYKDITHYESNLVYPPFLNSPLVTQPTGSGKTFAGLMTCMCMMIRTRGSSIQLFSPLNGHAIWCVPTTTLVEDISNAFSQLVRSHAFSLLAPRNVNVKNIERRYITTGYGAVKPEIKYKMFCIMTYEYARTQLTNVIIDDIGMKEAGRPSLLISMRCCIIDEAHYIVCGGERAMIADNIALACRCFSIPILMLTATPNPEFLNFVDTIKCEQINKYNFPVELDRYDANAARQHEIVGKCVCVPREMVNDFYLTSNNKSLINSPNKLIAYRALLEAKFHQDDELTSKSILFIQNIQQVQYLAAYICGLNMAIYFNNSVKALMRKLVNYAIMYLREDVYIKYENRFYLKKVNKGELLKCFKEGLSDIIEGFSLENEILNSVYMNMDEKRVLSECINKENFIHFICVSLHIIPYFSNMCLDKESSKMVKDMILGDKADYILLVTTSVILEGVNIAGAEKIFITADGFSQLTNTQYTQLEGRVGRKKRGYVETWMYATGGSQQKGSIFKQRYIMDNKEGEVNSVCRIIESDELIDRILFAKMLYDKIVDRGNKAFIKATEEVSINRVTNNYYRGIFKPILSSFFVLASISQEHYLLEQSPNIYNKDENEYFYRLLEDYFSKFDSIFYNIFFKIYSNVACNLSSPHIMLDTISFINNYIKYTNEFNYGVNIEEEGEINNNKSSFIEIPTQLFIPLFAQYSFAFDFNNANLALMTPDKLDVLRRKGFNVVEISNRERYIEDIQHIYEMSHHGSILTTNEIKNIELATKCFACSMFIDPILWFKVFHISFADALSYIVSYFYSLRSIIAELDFATQYSNMTPVSMTPCAVNAKKVIDIVDFMLKDISSHHIAPYLNNENTSYINQKVIIQNAAPGQRAIYIDTPIIEYARRASNTPRNKDYKTIAMNYIESAPLKVDNYVVRETYQDIDDSCNMDSNNVEGKDIFFFDD